MGEFVSNSEDMNVFVFLSLLIIWGTVANASDVPDEPRPKSLCDDFKALSDLPKMTPLKAAAQCGLLKKVKELLKGGADPNDSKGARTPLMVAVLGPRYRIVRLPKDHPDHGTGTKNIVLEPDQLEIIKELLKAGADVDAKTIRRHETALMYAAASSVPEVVNLLIKYKANVNATACYGTKYSGDKTALMRTSRNARYGLEIAKILLDNGADVNVIDDLDRTALSLTQKRDYFIYDQDKKDLLKLLKKHGAKTPEEIKKPKKSDEKCEKKPNSKKPEKSKKSKKSAKKV